MAEVKSLFGFEIFEETIGSISTNIDTTKIFATSQLLTTLTQIPVQPNKAIVGANAFAHESGIHQDGMLKNRKTYEIMTPESVGVAEHQIVLGKHSGKNAVFVRIVNLKITFDETQKEAIFVRFKQLADTKKTITDQDLVDICR